MPTTPRTTYCAPTTRTYVRCRAVDHVVGAARIAGRRGVAVIARFGWRSGGRVATVATAVAVAFAVLIGPGSARAVPLPEHSTEWLARTAWEITTELRRAEAVSVVEHRDIAARAISEAASLVAHHLNADPAALRRAWLDAPLARKIAVFSALSQLGVPYRLNGDAPFVGLDCSALTKYAWGQAGVALDRGSASQFARGQRVAVDRVRAGDLVWYPGHIMMSLGVPDLIVHARSGQRAVEIHRIASERLSWMRWVDPTSR